MAKLPIAIVGGSGYTGAELLRLLLLHPRMEIQSISAGRAAGQNIDQVFPQFRGRLNMPVTSFEPESVAKSAKLAFTALPHAQSAPVVAALRDAGLAVVDLSADFRLQEESVYNEWYGTTDSPKHPCPERLADAVYGLPELHREAIANADLVAAPGCYPTGAILAASAFLDKGLIKPEKLIVDSKSGVSGAGRNASQAAHFPEVGEGIRPYKVAGTHRHTPEMEQELSLVAGRAVSLSFTPHLVPMSRGILSCVYGEPTDHSLDAAAYQDALENYYEAQPFVQVLPVDALPDTSFVRGSNLVHVAVRYDPRVQRVVMMSAIDNLCKGSSGQAVQCANLMQGWDESLGLEGVAAFP